MKITNLKRRLETSIWKLMIYIQGKIHGSWILLGATDGVPLDDGKILKPDGGSIDYEGLTGRDITMMSQRPYLMDASVYQNLIYPLTLRGIRPDEDAVDQMLEKSRAFERRAVPSSPAGGPKLSPIGADLPSQTDYGG